MRRRPAASGLRETIAWLLQFGALVVAPASLLIGMAYDAVRFEVGLLGLAGAMFLVGRLLQRPGG